MKVLCLVLTVGALAGPVVSFAQNTAPITREQVRADLIRLEQAGYHVGDGDATTYPAEIQAAEAKIAAEGNQLAANNAVGGTTTTGTSAAGSRVNPQASSSSSCVGPASYCNLFFGN